MLLACSGTTTPHPQTPAAASSSLAGQREPNPAYLKAQGAKSRSQADLRAAQDALPRAQARLQDAQQKADAQQALPAPNRPVFASIAGVVLAPFKGDRVPVFSTVEEAALGKHPS